MTPKYKLGIVGCGKLGKIVAQAIVDGLLPEYALAGATSLHLADAEALTKLAGGVACETVEALLAQKPDYIVEAASPTALRALAPLALAAGVSIVTLSIGAFADQAFYEQCAADARAHGARIHLASGAIGGFDVLRTTALMGGKVTASITTEKGPDSLRGTPLFEESLMGEKREVFSGTATDAIALLPTKVNVAVAASLATVGPEQMRVSINSTPGFVGDDHRIEVDNDEVHAVVDIYSKTSAIAGWSVVALLQNIVSPIVF